MSISLIPFNPQTDYPRWVEIINRVGVEPVTIEMLQQEDAIRPPNQLIERYKAVNETGEIIGLYMAQQPMWRRSGHFQIMVMVDTRYQRQGYGTQLYEAGLNYIIEHKPTHIFSFVRDDVPASLHFAEKRGYRIDRHLFVSVLDVAAFDESPFAGVVESVSATGIRFTTFAELGDTAENRQKLHEFITRSMEDIPGDYTPQSSFETFEKMLFGMPELPLAVSILALNGDQWIGAATLSYRTADTAYHFMTGVDRAYRGRQIALSLKLLTVCYAKEHNLMHLYTNNDSYNAPMLAINEKMGYQRRTGGYIVMLIVEDDQPTVTNR